MKNCAGLQKKDRGYIVIGVLFLLILGTVICSGMINGAITAIKTRSLVKLKAQRFYQVEETMNKIINWLQANSKNIVSAFRDTSYADGFVANFDLGAPALGENEGEFFGVPTLVKMKGTNNSVMLSNNDFFGEDAFPATKNVDTDAAFDAISSFQTADLGLANARIILMWARDAAGNYEPVFRIDAVTGNNPDRGVHSFAYAYSTLITSGGGKGFYGKNGVKLWTANNTCVSNEWTKDGVNPWQMSADKSNCPISSSNGAVVASAVSGTASSLLDNGVTLEKNGKISGGECEGESCTVGSLPTVNAWVGYCPGAQADLLVDVNQNLTSGCRKDITINAGRTLTLTDHTAPYYFRSINFNGNGAELKLAPIPEGKKITVYLEALDNYHLNANRFLNPDNAPHQFELIYLGVETLKLNGGGINRCNLISPNATVEVMGNFDYYGGIQAKYLEVSGAATLNYDEALGVTPVVSDLHFTLHKTSQRYR